MKRIEIRVLSENGTVEFKTDFEVSEVFEKDIAPCYGAKEVMQEIAKKMKVTLRSL